jgi:tetratricopeptide (TPR) repeat protein
MNAKTSFPQRSRAAVPDDPWIVRHWQQVLLALAVGLTAVLLTALVSSRLQKAEEQAWEQLSYAMAQAAQGQRTGALSTLDNVLSIRRSGAPAVQALLLKSEVLLAEGKKDDALAAAREALRQAPSDEYKALSEMSLAYTLDQTGSADKALEEYLNFIAQNPDHFMVPRAHYQVGRLRAAKGEYAQAKETFEKLITLYPATVWARDAKAALEAINRTRTLPK